MKNYEKNSILSSKSRVWSDDEIIKSTTSFWKKNNNKHAVRSIHIYKNNKSWASKHSSTANFSNGARSDDISRLHRSIADGCLCIYLATVGAGGKTSNALITQDHEFATDD